ncbi:MAG: 6-phosphofructokinase [Defluviitaleaceae bacterium]|nr:6-phosphofructokinase [Defluviitaleaceae bacterium]
MGVKGNAIVAQSGGMTAAINATLAGVYETAAGSADIGKVFGALHGIEGIINNNLVEMNLTADEVERLKTTPGGYLGSCRYKLPDPVSGKDVYDKILNTLKDNDIRYFFYIGGNDSMDTANKVSTYLREHGHEILAVGLPKTIDNDLPITDHTPGFGSAAKYIATTCSEIYLDVKSFDIPYVTIVEIMGRNAGWLTAAAALVRERYDSPDLIYLPEVPFDLEQFFVDLAKVREHKPAAIVVISEGIMTKEGQYFAELAGDLTSDNFGHKNLGGSASLLASHVKERLGCKVRAIEFSLLQRCAGHLVSATDINESFAIGKAGVSAALSGKSGIMMTYQCEREPVYKMTIGHCALSDVANIERKIPREWINKEGNFPTKECNDYIRPLIQGEIHPVTKNGVPDYLYLEK